MQTDDVGVFGSRLSNEYLLVAHAFKLNRFDCIDLCDRAVEVIFADQHQRARLWTLINDFRQQLLRTG